MLSRGGGRLGGGNMSKMGKRELGFGLGDDVKTKYRRLAHISRERGTLGYTNIHMHTAFMYVCMYVCILLSTKTPQQGEIM